MKKTRSEIVSPVVKPMLNLPEASAFEEVLQFIQTARQRAYQAVNTELITLYWQVGEYISRKIGADGWGKGTIQNLGTYLQKAQPGIRGFSPQNIWRMRQFYEAYQKQPILSAVLRELPWTQSGQRKDPRHDAIQFAGEYMGKNQPHIKSII